MSLAQLLNREVTIIQRSESGTQDDYGTDIPGETLTETTGYLEQRRRDEPNDQGEMSDSGWLLVLPAGTDIDTGDAVTVDGHEYEVVGEPWVVTNPRLGTDSQVEVTLKRTASEGDAS